MAELMDVRARGGIYEILKTKGSEGEEWVPLGTEFVRSRMLECRPGEYLNRSVAEELEAEGWISPFVELPVCGAHSTEPVLERARCLLRAGHEGWHRDGNTSWEEGFRV